MDKPLHYLFDPLCGWCYGAAPAVTGLQAQPGIDIELLPTGMFSGDGARPMDDAFAAYAWSNDQRIEGLTGQRFSERYRDQVLGNRQQRFDSGPATLALTAVSVTDPARELESLKAIQHARFVAGSDVTSLANLADLLNALDLGRAAARLTHLDADLLGVNQARTERARALMRELGARGVPTLVAESGTKRWVLDHAAAYSDPLALVGQLEVVLAAR
ncbi:MAG: DsbA family protein [Rhodoferax sp.]|nr:DsbA family protein [Rhodoferax sp.]